MTPENTTPADVREMTSYLLDKLGPTAVAFACACRSRETVNQWASGDKVPDEDDVARLSVCYRAFKEVSSIEGDDIARTWFLGSNCCEMTQSPLETILHGNFDEVRTSVSRMCDPEDMGG